MQKSMEWRNLRREHLGKDTEASELRRMLYQIRFKIECSRNHKKLKIDALDENDTG
jgi:hypothetical protein